MRSCAELAPIWRAGGGRGAARRTGDEGALRLLGAQRGDEVGQPPVLRRAVQIGRCSLGNHSQPARRLSAWFAQMRSTFTFQCKHCGKPKKQAASKCPCRRELKLKEQQKDAQQ